MLVQTVLVLLQSIACTLISHIQPYNMRVPWVLVNSVNESLLPTGRALPRTRFRHSHCLRRLYVPRTARRINIASVASVVSASLARRVASTSLPSSRRSSQGTHLLGTTHGASSVSAPNVSRPALKLSPAAAHVLTWHVSHISAHVIEGSRQLLCICDKRLVLGAAMHGDAPSTYTLLSVCYLLASVSQNAGHTAIAHDSHEDATFRAQIWQANAPLPSRAGGNSAHCLSSSGKVISAHPYLGLFLFGAVMRQPPVGEQLRQHRGLYIARCRPLQYWRWWGAIVHTRYRPTPYLKLVQSLQLIAIS